MSSIYEEKNVKIGKNILAFLLFLCLLLLSLSICVRAVFVNSNVITRVFTDKSYADALFEDIYDYAVDYCDASAVDKKIVDETVTYEKIYSIQKAYILNIFEASEQYNERAFNQDISDLNGEIVKAANVYLESISVELTDNIKKGTQNFADNICDYIRDRISVDYIDEASSLVSTAKTASSIMIAVFMLASVILITSLYYTGEKRYRAVRYITYSFTAAALTDALLALGVQVIKCFKDLVIYPYYLCDALMKHINNCVLSVALAAALLFFAALIFAAYTWRLKFNKK
ncbi:MAG: hypothetical protein ACI4IE_03135 [Eubacterium sp.]